MLVVSALGIAAWWLGGYGKKADDYRSYFIKTTSLPSGIKRDSTVKFIGVDAGSVKDIRFADEKEALIELELSVISLEEAQTVRFLVKTKRPTSGLRPVFSTKSATEPST